MRLSFVRLNLDQLREYSQFLRKSFFFCTPSYLTYCELYSAGVHDPLYHLVSEGGKQLGIIISTRVDNRLSLYEFPPTLIKFEDSMNESEIWKQYCEFLPDGNEVFNDLYNIIRINLSLSEEEIYRNIRGSYRSLINWGKRELKTVIVDSKNPDAEEFYKLREFHIKTAGKQTRSNETWELQFESLKQNESFMLNHYLKDELVSSVYVISSYVDCFYGIGVMDRVKMANKMPVGHWPVVEAIFEAKRRGLRTFYLDFLSSLYNRNEKMDKILFFKEGFSKDQEVKVFPSIRFKS